MFVYRVRATRQRRDDIRQKGIGLDDDESRRAVRDTMGLRGEKPTTARRCNVGAEYQDGYHRPSIVSDPTRRTGSVHRVSQAT
jgi:hypothetical protein